MLFIIIINDVLWSHASSADLLAASVCLNCLRRFLGPPDSCMHVSNDAYLFLISVFVDILHNSHERRQTKIIPQIYFVTFSAGFVGVVRFGPKEIY